MDRRKGERSEAVGRTRKASYEEEVRQEKERKRMPARQKLVMNVPAEILGRGVVEEVWRAKGRDYVLSRDKVVDGARCERLHERGGDLEDWVLMLPTFMHQSLVEDRKVLVARAKRRVRKYVEVLKDRDCSGSRPIGTMACASIHPRQ